MRINNNNFQRNANISRVAQVIWKKTGISRIEIARELDLYRSTVSNIINNLIENKLVIETEEGESLPQGGRKPIGLSLNTAFGCVIGLEVQPTRYRAVVTDMFGNILLQKKNKIHVHDFIASMDEIMNEFIPLVIALGIPMIGLCVGIPGIIDSENGIVIMSDPFNLVHFDFAKHFNFRYGIPAIVENDANCCAWLQLTLNRGDNLKDFIVLMAEFHEYTEKCSDIPYGMGVGLALALDGRVRSGQRHAIGEFVSTSWNPDKKGQTGLSDEIMAYIATNDEYYEIWLEDLLTAMVPLIAMLNPEVFFIHGDPIRRHDLIEKVILERVPQFTAILKKTNCSLQFGSEDVFGVSHGAAAMLLQQLFSVPDFSEIRSVLQLDWDSVFEQSNKIL